MNKLFLCISLLLVGCATVTNEEKHALGVATAKCLISASKRLDDGISPADTVAVGVISECQRQIDQYDEARVPDKGFTTFAQAFWANRMTGWIKQTTAIVLKQRVENKNIGEKN
jgi:hypothetical protein